MNAAAPPSRAARAARRAPLVILLALACAPVARAQQAAEGWGWRQPIDPEVPYHGQPVADEAQRRHPIDAFLDRRRSAAGLDAAPAADRATLARRAAYDLTGLPPSPEDVAAFAADEADDAWARWIDRHLDMPQYGERWARHWLDVVRFAETDSYERDRLKPGAWRYRDYVIDAFNGDKPYDRFALEQLAGDELARPTLETIIATGYYRLGIWDDEPTDPKQAVYDDLDGIADTTARTFLAVSMGCARCHDHKKDPLPTADYYRFLATFEGIKPYKVGGGNSTAPQNYLRRVPAHLGKANDFADRVEEVRRRWTALSEEARSIHAEVDGHLSDAERAAAQALAQEGRVLHLPFDDAQVHDDRASVRNVDLVEGHRGGAAMFRGSNGSEGTLRNVAPESFTISLWFRTEHEGRGRDRDPRWFLGSGILDGEVPGIVDDLGISIVGKTLCCGVGNPETFLHSHDSVVDGQWHHATMTRDHTTGHVALYLDGALQDQKVGGKQMLLSPPQLVLGRMQPGGGHYRGALDEVEIFERALDAREVLLHHLGMDPGAEERIAARIGRPEAQRFRAAIDGLLGLEWPRPDFVEVLCVQEHGPTIQPSYVRIRGSVHAKGPQVEAGMPSLFGGAVLRASATAPELSPPTSGRRLALARWLTGEGKLFLARVMVNRIWQHHFGRGLARDPNDFGNLGVEPTHPELLDWLAHRFAASGFSVKAMHRLIMTSAAYQMAYRHDDRAATVDPLNDLFWRFDLRRLAAEEIRDSILEVAGVLNREGGGPGVYPPMPEEVLATSSRPGAAWGKSSTEQARRRSIYIHAKRSLLHPLLLSFDLADTDTSCPVRFATTQPTQALTLMNSAFAQEHAALFAARLQREADDTAAQVARALQLTTQRAPSYGQVADGLEFIAELQREEQLSADQALRHYCLVLLNSNAFLFVD